MNVCFGGELQWYSTFPDPETILATFKPIQEILKKTPRMDTPGAEPSATVSRSCQ